MVIKNHVLAGREREYEAWVQKISNFAHTHFEGHLGASLIPPSAEAAAGDDTVW